MKNKGFTLIEGMIVFCLVVILAAVAIPKFLNLQQYKNAVPGQVITTLPSSNPNEKSVAVVATKNNRIVSLGEGIYRFNYNLASEPDKFQVALVEFRRDHVPIVGFIPIDHNGYGVPLAVLVITQR